MSGTTHGLEELEREVNELILAGKAMEAFEKFYADDVVMQENSQTPTIGKEANRKREYDFFATIVEFHGVQLQSSAVGDDVSMSEWSFDATYRDGVRRVLNEVTRRQWRNGKIVNERFYYTMP